MSKKPWYEKAGTWITIAASICTILGVSVFGNVLLSKNGSESNTKFDFESADITVASGGTLIIGGTSNEVKNHIEINDTNLTPESEEFKVVASYDMNTVQSSIEGIDVIIKAETSFSAEYVTISAISDELETAPINMHGGTYNWYFNANFYIKGTYTIIITAYNSEGESVSDEFTYIY